MYVQYKYRIRKTPLRGVHAHSKGHVTVDLWKQTFLSDRFLEVATDDSMLGRRLLNAVEALLEGGCSQLSIQG